MGKYTCPCCGYKTLDEEPSGTFDICKNCYWEDDNVMNDNPDYWGGANGVCLRQAQRNFIRYGASEKTYVGNVVMGKYEKDPLWKPIWEQEARPNEKKLAQILIEGNIIDSGFKNSVNINKFLDEFTDFLERKGWSFGGEIKQEMTEIDKD
ncbi:hypothetical protein GKZ89_05250 [Bacillus mangrovi]|uniref:Cysteine-rich CPCC domain-containing protein n=1 Tax=Metabacillus mangrovi TaxID=1491830 RepID=A0A7X2S3Z6_9BACI|nr:hypothetical protein [Metabacillus mangrovi]